MLLESLFDLLLDLVRLCGRLVAALLRPLGAARALGPVFPLVTHVLGLALLFGLVAGLIFLVGLYLGLTR